MKNRETDEWLQQNHKSTRNFIRKWGHFVKHDALMKPIIPLKYDIGFIVRNCKYETLYELEPWCSNIYIDWYEEMNSSYIEQEQPNTMFNLSERIHSIHTEPDNDIEVRFDAAEFTPEQFNYLAQLSEILSNDEELEEGSFNLGIFEININKIKTYEKELIKCE